MSLFIKVECEYDISGAFGGNNNQHVFMIGPDYDEDDVEKIILKELSSRTGLYEEELEDLYNWEYIDIKELGV